MLIPKIIYFLYSYGPVVVLSLLAGYLLGRHLFKRNTSDLLRVFNNDIKRKTDFDIGCDELNEHIKSNGW